MSEARANEAMNKAIRSARSDGGTKAFIERLKKSFEREKEEAHDKNNRNSK